jgi:hypothetical protein
MKLIKDEEILISSDSNKIVATNLRIYQSDKEWGKSFSLSINLEDISSIETSYHSYIVLIVIGIIIALFGLTQLGINNGGTNYTPVLGILVGAIFIGFWFASRKNVIKVCSKGGSHIMFKVEGMSADSIEDFLNNVLSAKVNRINKLHGMGSI